MGFADRHYQRTDLGSRGRYGGGGGGGRRALDWRLWSVNTWLIAICVSIFVADSFLPKIEVVMDRSIEAAALEAGVNPRSDVRRGDLEVLARDRYGQIERGFRPLFATVAGQETVVGEELVRGMRPIEAALHYSTRRMLHIEFWRLIGFQFLHTHDTLMHLLMNMMGLFFFGPLVERELGSKRYLAFYLLCGIAGALLYTILNVGGIVVQQLGGGTVDFLLFNDPATPLIGASAGVFGVLIAGARIAPHATVYLFFVVPVRFGLLAWLIVGFEMLMLLMGADNQGGHAAHLGGAFAGWYLMRNPHHLQDFFDVFGRLRGRASPAPAPAPRPVGGGGARRSVLGRAVRGAPDPGEVDRILDKVFRQGLSSLTKAERTTLEKAREASESDDRRTG